MSDTLTQATRSDEPILIVDDDPGVCAVLTRFLGRRGYAATAYESPGSRWRSCVTPRCAARCC
ncbi:MAG: hypothetical protein IPK07_34230 [Deltaproteobacteria bacterium]|nr:hypothetical protein [Deltaproteobacteria bacterium]